MKHFKVTTFLIIAVFCLLPLESCKSQPRKSAEKTSKEDVSQTAGLNGTWKGKGVDTRGVTWKFTFTLTQKDTVIEGESTWEGSDGSSAASTMRGKINFAKKSFMLKDVDLNDVSGDVAAAIYTGIFSDDFRKMTGKWTITNGGSPGTFEAVKE